MGRLDTWFDRLWHERLGRPYRLMKSVDIGDKQLTPVLLLHGIGRYGTAWRHVVDRLEGRPVRVVAFDLLGFGASPKPERIKYTTDDHAQAVIAAIERYQLVRRGSKLILVGHSMGCLIAVRVARLRPDLVKHLVLYEMPLYKGLPDKRSYRLRTNIYFRLYERVVTYRPIFKPGQGKRRAQKLAERIAGFTLSDETWRPFVRSLKHTIMEQTTAEDLKHLKMPMDVIYGTKDRVVIRGKTTEIFGDDVENITAHTIKENHGVSKKAGLFLSKRVLAAAGLNPDA